MPAIQPARLKQQAALLAEHFDAPAAFVRSLYYLLQFYADRTHRSGQAGEPSPLVEAYNVPAPALRLILQPLLLRVEQEPEEALALCEALWREPYLEFRVLAAALLGEIPPRPAEVISNRITLWAEGEDELRLIDNLFNEGLARLRREKPEQVLNLVHSWLESQDAQKQRLGLRALLPLLQDLSFQNLPRFFRLLQPLFREAPQELRPDLLEVSKRLARRSPRETAYFLRQCLEVFHGSGLTWIIRQSLPEFPSPVQQSLREALRSSRWGL